MNKQSIKFIRGVRNKGEEISRYLQDLGVRWDYTPFFCNENDLFYFGENKILCGFSVNSPLGQLIIENCEELFLPAKFKYKVGDKVEFQPMDTTRAGTIVELIDTDGYPRYRVKYKDEIYFLNERDLTLRTEPKFKVGDAVKVKNQQSEDYERVGTITCLLETDRYKLKTTAGVIEISQDDLELYDKSQIKTWEDLEGTRLKGFEPHGDGELEGIDTYDVFAGNCKMVASTEKVAKAMIAMAQISQLFAYYGGMVTDEEWNDNSVSKYILVRMENEIEPCAYKYTYEFLAFHTEDQRDEFLANNERLVKDYLMLD